MQNQLEILANSPHQFKPDTKEFICRQSQLEILAKLKKMHWRNTVETLLVISSFSSTVALLIAQQVTFVSVPLSLSLVLNLVNRKKINDLTQKQQITQQAFSRKLDETQKFIFEISLNNAEEHENFYQELETNQQLIHAIQTSHQELHTKL